MKTTLFILCAFALVGCGSKSGGGAYVPKPQKGVALTTVAAGDEASLFPATVGNLWQYEVATSITGGAQNVNSKSKYGFEVKAVDPVDGGNQLTINLLNEDVVLTTQVWKVTASGIYQVSVEQGGKKIISVPDQLVAPFPIKVAAGTPEEVAWNGKTITAFGMSDVTSLTHAEGPEIVDTKAGLLSAYRFVTDSTVKGPKGEQGTMKTTAFFSPKVGLIKFVQRFQAEKFVKMERMELLQYTVK